MKMGWISLRTRITTIFNIDHTNHAFEILPLQSNDLNQICYLVNSLTSNKSPLLLS